MGRADHPWSAAVEQGWSTLPEALGQHAVLPPPRAIFFLPPAPTATVPPMSEPLLTLRESKTSPVGSRFQAICALGEISTKTYCE